MKKQRFTIIPAAHLITICDEGVLLLRRYNTGYEDGKYALISGHVEADEMPTDAVIREAKEEAGISISKKDLAFIHVLYRKGNDRMRVDFFFNAKKWKGMITNMEPEKCDDLSWFPLDKLPSNTIDFVRKVIADYHSCKFYSE